MRKSERVYFTNRHGHRLCGIIDRPTESPKAFGMFSHCFTCNKDLKSIVRISRLLAEQGWAILRFDFSGLGDSQGEFVDTNFDNNCDDVAAAADFLGANFEAPKLLIGHSLGGAALIRMAPHIDSAQALVTIASPSTTIHLADFLSKTNPDIVTRGSGPVEIGGRTYELKKQLIDNLRIQDLPAALQAMQLPHLIFHPLEDETLPYWHAEKMFELTGGPKSMVTLDQSDHLLVTRPEDVGFVASLIATWASRFISDA